MAATMPHRCDETCVCPTHHTVMWYSPAADDHACQAADCIYAGGVRALYEVWMDAFRPFL